MAYRHVEVGYSKKRSVGAESEVSDLGTVFSDLYSTPHLMPLKKSDYYEQEREKGEHSVEPSEETVQAVLLRFIIALLGLPAGLILMCIGDAQRERGRRWLGVGLICCGGFGSMIGLSIFMFGWPWSWLHSLCIACSA